MTTKTTTKTRQQRQRWTRGLALLGPVAAVALGPGLAAAQQVPPPMPADAPTTQPSGPSVIMPPARAARPTTQISMNFRDAPVDAVLEHLSEVAGFIVIKESPVDKRVTLFSRQPVSPDEAVSMLNSVLKASGYTAIRMGRTLKVMTIENAKKGNVPVRFGGDPDQIPETDDIVTQIVPVRSVDAVKLKADLQPLIGTNADLASNGGSNSIIITDTSANIHRVVQIIASLDKKDALETDIRIRALKFADATSAAKLITDLFKSPDQQAQGQQGGFNPFRGFGGFGRGGGGGGGFPGFPGGGGGQQASTDDKGHTGSILAEADTRTNTIVITGPTDTLKIIDGVLDKLDADPTVGQTFFIYKVKNGQALSIQNTLNTLFGVNVASSSSGRTTGSTGLGSNRLGGSGSGSSSGFGGGSSGGFGGGSSGGFGGGSSGGFGSSSGSGSRTSTGSNSRTSSASGNRGGTGGGGAASGLTGAAADLIGQVEVVADTDTNQLLVATATKYEAQVRTMIAELDRPVPQVLIKVLVAEVTHDRGDDLGVDFSVINARPSGLGENVTSNLGNALAQTNTGGVSVAILESRISATVHALATAGKLEVLSRPYILTSDNQEAYVLVGQEIPVITNTQVTEAGSTINSTRYQDVGISLDVTPHINPDGLVVMDVSPTISSLSDQSITVQSGISNPIINQRQAESHVGVRDGDTIVIGGLMQDQKNQTISKIPILGDIPYLGLLFQRDVVTKTKTELLIFLTPHVALAPDQLQRMSNDEMGGVQLTPNAVQPGTFPYHMQGMRRGGSTTAPVLPVPNVPRDRDSWEPEPKMP